MKIASTAPAAPSMWPDMELVELTARRGGWTPNTGLMAAGPPGALRGGEGAWGGRPPPLVGGGAAGFSGWPALLWNWAEESPPLEIEIVPGVTAACSGAAVLGAPLGHDFAVVSLSDLLTPWELIEKRLRAAAAADFVICLYNPASRGRPEHLARACAILMEEKPAATPAGWVRNAGRDGETFGVTTLGELPKAPIDMFCTVIVGNSATRELGGRLVTPRGYKN